MKEFIVEGSQSSRQVKVRVFARDVHDAYKVAESQIGKLTSRYKATQVK